MSTDSSASYYFLPWVRYGLLKNVEKMPELGKNKPGSDPSSGRLKINVDVQLSRELINDHVQNKKETVPKELLVFGPGDVAGIDPREIVRTEPRQLTYDFPPNLFPFIEFDRPDLPWLFTPGKPDSHGCLRPWIVLVVLRKQDGEITTNRAKPLPVLNCKINELPDLEESWAWAHAQYVGEHIEKEENIHSDVIAALENTKLSQQNVSRLICLRSLKENESYLACVVPAFEAGRKAGLGESDIKDNLDPAWKQSGNDGIQLPVYYHWEFNTRAEGDFEEFIDQLKNTSEVKLKTGPTRSMDVTLPIIPEETINIGIASALQQEDKSPGIPETLRTKLRGLINTSYQQDSEGVPLPIYGSWHVKKDAPGIPSLGDAGLPVWLGELNSDPRYRAAAALGTQVIQRQQEQLVAAAWEKTTGVEETNQWIRQQQLARDVTKSIYKKRIAGLSDDNFEQITEPLTRAARPERQAGNAPAQFRQPQPRSTEEAFKQSIAENPLSRAVVSASFRRMARAQGRLMRKLITSDTRALQMREHSQGQEKAPEGLLERIRAGKLQVAPPPGVTAATAAISGYQNTSNESSAPAASHRTLVASAPTGQSTSRIALMEKINPDITFSAAVRLRVEMPSEISHGPRALKGVSAPSMEDKASILPIPPVPLDFSQPMYEPLRDLFQDMLIPGGLDQVPNNSLVVLNTNAAFIEAYLVGLNHEMSRELLWREFPTHLGNTYFRQFWDIRGSIEPNKSREEFFDIPDISEWEKKLGENMHKERGKNLFMLLIKSDLLLRYPNTLIYARQAKWSRDNELTPSGTQVFPSMRINPVPGVTLLGFAIDPLPTDKLSDKNLGWFFVIEEQPTEIRFGLDLSNKGLTSWHELAWGDVKQTEGDYISVNTSKPKLTPPPGVDPDIPPDHESPLYSVWKRFQQDKDMVWGQNSAHMAYILLQKAYQIRIHSSSWFPASASGGSNS
jgi:hypothetical protein